MSGEVFDLSPGQPLVVDMAEGTLSLYKQDETKKKFHKDQLNRLHQCHIDGIQAEPVYFSQAELKIRKLRAGWHSEFDTMIMQALFQGSKNTSSMADQGPIEALVKGSFFDLGNFFKGNFSQVTNPALAKNEEEPYMSTLSFVGRKPALSSLD